MKQNTRERLRIYLMLLLFLVIAYLPLSSFLFALKNDALTTNFPNKYFFSAALHAGYLPLWNPYINFGLPLHADPGFAFWNPVTWIFGFIGYSIPMLSVEILFYIWVAGISSFELGLWLGHSRKVSFCIGVIFMSSGFFVGNLQHINFITCAAFLPFVVITYLDLHRSYTIRKLFFCLLSLYMLATGGHPAIPVGCLYFLLLIQAGLILFDDRGLPKKRLLMQSLRINFLLAGGFLVLAAPLLFSYVEIYPRFTRAAAVVQESLYDTGFDFSSYLSFLFPFSVTGINAICNNDLLMRNGYFSLAGLFCFLIALQKNKNAFQKVFLLAGSGMLLLSLGGHIKESLYSVLPLLDHIRTNGEFRVFAMLSFILVGASLMEDLMKGRHEKGFQQFLVFIGVISLLIITGRFIFTPLDTLFLRNPDPQSVDFLTMVKMWLHGLTFFDRFFLNAFLLVVLIGSYFLFRPKSGKTILLPLFIITDMITFCWAHLPVTGVQMKSPAVIEHYFSGIPGGIPIPALLPVKQNQYFAEDIQNLFGCWSYYSKQPGTPYFCNYPSRLNLTTAYFNSSLPDSMNQRPFVFTKEGISGENLKIRSFSPTEIDIQTESQGFDSLFLLQNDYFRWVSMVNGKPVKVEPTAIAFMAVPLKRGLNEIRFIYNSRSLVVVTGLSLFIWITFFLFVFKPDIFYFIRNIFP